MMTLRLDTTGLRKLIEENPSFKLDVQNAVLENIRKDCVDEAVKARLDQCLKGMMENKGTYYSPVYVVKDKKLQDAIMAVVTDAVEDMATKYIESRIDQMIEQERAKIRKDLQAGAKEAMMAAITPEMAKEILLSKLI
jgi:hypothetical protein